ncbi:MAG: hypothetical protein D6E12_06305 [Desulfovibrio sp.]|nr:MAG: hypothetical protein D6E12_06305 [Desulfovibrio sp.]
MDHTLPPNITLSPLDDPGQVLSPQALDAGRELESMGFAPCGTYTVDEFQGMTLAGYVRENDGVAAVVYEHPQAGVWTDFRLGYEDGQSVTVSNAPTGGELDPRPGHAKLFLAGIDHSKMLDELAALRRDAPVCAMSPESFAGEFTRLYEDEAAWRNSRSVSEDEVARVAEAMNAQGQEDISEYAVHRTARRYAELPMTVSQAWEVLHNWPCFAEGEDMTDEQYERFEDAADVFIRHPDPASLPMMLACLRQEQDQGLAMLVSEVLAEHPREISVAALKEVLDAGPEDNKPWAAELACDYPDQGLTPLLAVMLQERAPMSAGFPQALLALGEIHRCLGDPRASAAIHEAVQRCVELAEVLVEQDEPSPAFMVLLSVHRHLDEEQLALYERAKDQAQDLGLPTEILEALRQDGD